MQLDDQFNKKQSIKNSKAMLKNYGYYHQLSKMVTINPIKSPIISDMPKAPHHKNVNEDKMINRITIKEFAKQYCQLIDDTIDALDDDISQLILTEYYKLNHDDNYIADKTNISISRYYTLKSIALLNFALCCYGQPVMKDNGQVEYDPLLVMN